MFVVASGCFILSSVYVIQLHNSYYANEEQLSRLSHDVLYKEVGIDMYTTVLHRLFLLFSYRPSCVQLESRIQDIVMKISLSLLLNQHAPVTIRIMHNYLVLINKVVGRQLYPIVRTPSTDSAYTSSLSGQHGAIFSTVPLWLGFQWQCKRSIIHMFTIIIIAL